MKKLLVLVVLLLVVAGWAGATYVVGGKTEQKYFGLLAQYEQWGPLTLANQGYRRGFLSSSAETVMELAVPGTPQGGPADAAEPVRLIFSHSLRHGPLPFATVPGGGFSLAPALVLVETRLVGFSGGADELQTLFAEVPELKDSFAFSRIGFDGAANTLVQIPAFDKQAEGATIHWGGCTLETESAPGQKSLLARFEMPLVEFRAGEGGVRWSGIAGRFDLVEAFPLVYVGSSEVVFGSMEMALPDGAGGPAKKIEMNGLAVASDSSCDGKMVEYRQTMKLDGVTVAGKTYGPGVCELTMRNLDGMVLSNFQSRMQETYRSSASVEPDLLVAQMIPLYSELLLQLLAGKPELKIDRLHFVTPLGDIDGTLSIRFAGNEEVPDNPLALLERLDASGELSMHVDLAEAMVADSLEKAMKSARKPGSQASDEEVARDAELLAEVRLESYLAQNYLVREGEQLKATASFKEGELVLNGDPLPLF